MLKEFPVSDMFLTDSRVIFVLIADIVASMYHRSRERPV